MNRRQLTFCLITLAVSTPGCGGGDDGDAPSALEATNTVQAMHTAEQDNSLPNPKRSFDKMLPQGVEARRTLTYQTCS